MTEALKIQQKIKERKQRRPMPQRVLNGGMREPYWMVI